MRVLKLDGAKDPDEFIKKFGADRFRRTLEESKTGFEYRAERVLAAYRLEEGSEKIKASRELCAIIAEYWSAVEREVYLAYASKRLELPVDVLKNSVEQMRQKQRREQANRDSREAQATVKNFGDRINPEATVDPRAASAEETVLGLLIMFPEYRDGVEKGSFSLRPSDFITAFHRKVFEVVMARHASEAGFRFELLGMDFTPDEVGRIEKMEMTRQQLTHNGPEVFRSSVDVLKDIAAEKAASGGDLNSRLAYLREKKAKLHKGKVEET